MINKREFSGFLLTEAKIFFGEKVGDILTAMQELSEDAPNMGKRHLMRLIQNIVKQIRRILHGNWTFEEDAYLKTLQKIGVALMKGIDSNQDLPSLVTSATDALQELSDSLETPVSGLGSPVHGEE